MVYIQREFITPFPEISPEQLNKSLQKFYCRQENATAAGSVIARQNCNR